MVGAACLHRLCQRWVLTSTARKRWNPCDVLGHSQGVIGAMGPDAYAEQLLASIVHGRKLKLGTVTAQERLADLFASHKMSSDQTVAATAASLLNLNGEIRSGAGVDTQRGLVGRRHTDDGMEWRYCTVASTAGVWGCDCRAGLPLAPSALS